MTREQRYKSLLSEIDEIKGLLSGSDSEVLETTDLNIFYYFAKEVKTRIQRSIKYQKENKPKK